MPARARPASSHPSSSSSDLSQLSYSHASTRHDAANRGSEFGAGEAFHTVDLSSDLDGLDLHGFEQWSKLDSMPASGMSNDDDEHYSNEQPKPSSNGDKDIVQPREREFPQTTKAIHRWIRALHRKALQRQELAMEGTMHLETEEAFDIEDPHCPRPSSDSSAAFVTAIKSASASVASTSLLGRSRKNTLRSSRGHSRNSRTDLSSKASVPGTRLSVDSAFAFADRPIAADPAVTERSLQRRRILEELIETEESYIGDIRFLMNVSFACQIVTI